MLRISSMAMMWQIWTVRRFLRCLSRGRDFGYFRINIYVEGENLNDRV